MRREDVIGIVSSSGVPCVYGWWRQGSEPARPYAVLHYLYDGPVRADNERYVERDRWQVDLVADREDLSSAALVERALGKARIPFERRASDGAEADEVRTVYRFWTIG